MEITFFVRGEQYTVAACIPRDFATDFGGYVVARADGAEIPGYECHMGMIYTGLPRPVEKAANTAVEDWYWRRGGQKLLRELSLGSGA